jgi:hypothetical protein
MSIEVFAKTGNRFETYGTLVSTTRAQASTLTTMKRFKPRRIKLVTALVFVAALILAATVGRNRIKELLAEPAPVSTPAEPQTYLSDEEQAFYDAVVPRMLVIDAEAQVLAEMGREHSRNLIELETRRDRVMSNAAQIDTYVTKHGVPARFQSSFDEFFRGVTLLEQAMNESREGMLTLNWDEVEDAISVFEAGAQTVASATDRIQQLTIIATATADQDVSEIPSLHRLRYSELTHRMARPYA